MDKQIRTAEGAKREIAQFPFDGQALRLAVWPMELWLQWQADVLRAAASATADWMTRRREGTEAALRALARLSACQDANDASSIQSEWIAEETKRLESDIRALSTPTLLPQREAAKASRHTGESKRAPR